MRCKPNQLCYVSTSFAGNNGKFVTTGMQVGTVDFRGADGKITSRENVWTVTGDGLNVGEGFKKLQHLFPGMDGLFPDTWLTPFSDPDMNTDEDMNEDFEINEFKVSECEKT